MNTQGYNYRLMWGHLRELFGEVAEDILRMFIAINFGYEHISDMSEKNIEQVENWINDIVEAFS